MCEGKGLEQGSHFFRVGQAAMRSNVTIKGGPGEVLSESLRTLCQTQSFQQHPLRRQPCCLCRAGGGGNSLKVDMTRQVRFPRRGQGINDVCLLYTSDAADD